VASKIEGVKLKKPFLEEMDKENGQK